MKEREGGKEEEEMEQKETRVTMCQPKSMLCSNSISYAICSHHWDINSQRQGFFWGWGEVWCVTVMFPSLRKECLVPEECSKYLLDKYCDSPK